MSVQVEKDDYLLATKQIVGGKRLPGDVYLHKTALNSLPDYLKKRVLEINNMVVHEWDIIKVSRTKPCISLLSYPAFDTEPYPALEISSSFDLLSGVVKVRSYTGSENPPILHRKETFVLPDYPLYADFQFITQEAERCGLFDSPRAIGFRLLSNICG